MILIGDTVAVFSLTCPGSRTPVAGGRRAGSSVMLSAIPPDYVPHVRVRSGEKKFPLSAKDTHLLYPPLECPPATLQCASYLTEKTKENNNPRYLEVCSKMNTSFQRREMRLPLAAGSGVKAGAGL